MVQRRRMRASASLQRRWPVLFAAALAVGLGGPATVTAQSAGELLPFLPDDANAITVVRVQSLLQTPRAQREGWADRQREAFLAGAETLPPWVEVAVRGSHVHPGSPESSWSAAVIASRVEIDMRRVAEHEGSSTQMIAGRPAVLSSRNSYLVKLGPRLLGAMRPAFRQDVARWLWFLDAGREAFIRPYLRSAVDDEASHIILAFDMREMLEPDAVKQRLEASPALEGRPGAIEALQRLLKELQGVRFSVRVGDETSAEFRIDFGAPVSRIGEYIKPLVLELLADSGSALEELQDAAVELEERAVVMRMSLSDASLRRVMSLMLTPYPTAHLTGPLSEQVASPPPAETDSRSQRVAASQQYFAAVDQVLSDLQRANRNATSYSRTAKWHERFAEKISQLPIANIDEDLVEYGGSVASKLRALAASLSGVPVDVNLLERTVTYNMHYTPPWGGVSVWGGAAYRPPSVNVTSNLREVRERQAAAIARGAEERRQIWQMLLDERGAMRRKLTGKYNVEFGQAE